MGEWKTKFAFLKQEMGVGRIVQNPVRIEN
jgi:hypothetical protein